MANGGYSMEYKDLWPPRGNLPAMGYYSQGMDYLASAYSYYPPAMPNQMYADYIQHYGPSFPYAHDARGVNSL